MSVSPVGLEDANGVEARIPLLPTIIACENRRDLFRGDAFDDLLAFMNRDDGRDFRENLPLDREIFLTDKRPTVPARRYMEILDEGKRIERVLHRQLRRRRGGIFASCHCRRDRRNRLLGSSRRLLDSISEELGERRRERRRGGRKGGR